MAYNAQEIAFVKLLNEYRVAHSLQPLLVSDTLSLACERHGSDMAKYKFFSHTSLQSDWFPVGSSPWDRMRLCSYNYSTSKGEIMAAGQATAGAVFNTWKGSAVHNAHMLNANYKVLGVGFVAISGSPYTYYWVANFGGVVDPTAHTLGGTSGATRYQQTDPLLTYLGPWSTSSTSAASGGSFRYTASSGGAVIAKFNGTSLTWIAKKSPAYGKAQVTLDGRAPVTVDLYSPNTLYGQKVWSTGDLPAGAHTVKIGWTGTRRAAATATYISADAFDVNGTLVQAPTTTRYQEGSGQLVYRGIWKPSYTGLASGGSFAYANTSGSSVTVTFVGTYLAWIAKKSSAYGKARVTVDNGSPVIVDLYSSSTLWVQRAWNTPTLSSGTHTVKIEWTGTRNASAGGTNIGLDAFDVLGTLK